MYKIAPIEKQRCNKHNERELNQHKKKAQDFSTLSLAGLMVLMREHNKQLMREHNKQLQRIPDQPGCDSYIRLQEAISNSLVDWTTTRRTSQRPGPMDVDTLNHTR